MVFNFAAFDFATVSGCDKLVVGTLGTLDLLKTDVPDLVGFLV